ADRANLRDRLQPGRVEDIGTRRLERPETSDRVLEIGVPTDVVLRPRGEHERKRESPGRLDRGGDPLDRVVEVVETGVLVVVLDRAADGAGLGDPRDRQRGALRLRAVAVLE